jgi:hypothetical protein
MPVEENKTATNVAQGSTQPSTQGATPVPTTTVQTSAPAPKKVEVSEDLLKEMMARVNQADGLMAAFTKQQETIKNLETKMANIQDKPDEWYEQQKALFESGKIKGKTVRVLRYGDAFVVGYANYSANPKLEVLERIVPNPNNPDEKWTMRRAQLMNVETKEMTEVEVRFPTFLDECTEEVCSVEEEKLKEETISEGQTIVREYDEKHGYKMNATGETRELFVKIQKRMYLLKTSVGNILFSERWINQK